MSMYLPNPLVHSTEADPVEFLDLPRMAEAGDTAPQPSGERDRDGSHLSSHARVDIARSVCDYIAQLVSEHGGDGDDVRSVIRDLSER